MSETRYHPEYVAVYKASGSNLPISIWSKVIGEKLPMFHGAHNKIYKPVKLRIRLKKKLVDPEGTVAIEVPLGDKTWYAKLGETLAEMTGLAASRFSIVNANGECIRDKTWNDLDNSLDLKLQDVRTGKALYVDKIIPPPKAMQSDKDRDIIEWVDNIRNGLATKIITELSHHDKTSLSAAVARDGPVQKQIQKYITGAMPSPQTWPQFLQTYAGCDAVRALDPADVAHQLSQSVLVEVRKSLRAHKEQIHDYFNSLPVKSQDLEEPLWGDPVSESLGTNRYESSVQMFQDVVDAAVFQPILVTKFYYTIHNGQNVASHQKGVYKKKEKKEKEKHKRKKLEGEVHPMTEFYNKHYYERFGSVPGHVRSNLGRMPAYPGETNRVANAFYLFSGRAPFPDDIKSELSDLPPLTPLAKLIPFKKENEELDIPELGPLAPRGKLVAVKNKNKTQLRPVASKPMPDLIPYQPHLVPIEDVMHHYEDEAEELVDGFPLF